MDRHDPSNSLESDPAIHPHRVVRDSGQGQAPAGSLMSIQIRRRTLPRNKQPVPPKHAAPPAEQTVHAEPAIAPPSQIDTQPTAPKPAAPVPIVAAPTTAHPAGDPGRRMQSSTLLQATPADPPVPAAAPTPPAEPTPPAAPAPTESVPPPAARTPLNSPGIARHARANIPGRIIEGDKPHLAMPATKPAAPKPSTTQQAKTPPPQEAAKPPPTPAPTASRPEGIVSYWLRLRGNRRFPSTADLDENRIGTDWPNSILMRCRVGSKVLEPEKVFTSSNKMSSAAPSGASQTAMELSPMMLQWLLTLAGDAAKDHRPMQDTEAFPSHNQSIRYGAFALPFSEDQNQIDHVLCHVYRAD